MFRSSQPLFDLQRRLGGEPGLRFEEHGWVEPIWISLINDNYNNILPLESKLVFLGYCMVLRPGLFLLATWVFEGVVLRKTPLSFVDKHAGSDWKQWNIKKDKILKTRKSLSILMPFSPFSQNPFSVDQELFRPRGTLGRSGICPYYELFISQHQAWSIVG